LEDLFGSEQVDAPEFVILAPIAPRRARGALCPPLCHEVSPPQYSDIRLRIVFFLYRVVNSSLGVLRILGATAIAVWLVLYRLVS
jgi:hypothetical protein